MGEVMDKKPLIGVSICAVVLLVLASLSNVVGYQTVESSHQAVINTEVNQKELLFQTIVDIANNKEIQGILLRYQLSQGILPDTTIPVLTMKQLRQMYLIGLLLSKSISKAKMHSMIEHYQVDNQWVQKEITAVIEKDAVFNREIKRLSNFRCGCETNTEYIWTFPVLCTLLHPLYIFTAIIWVLSQMQILIPVEIMLYIGSILDCWWT
jgi:hypothetical protein